MKVLIVTPDMVREFTGNDVLCLDPICQPMVTAMQAVIRHQQDQLTAAVKAMEYSIHRQRHNLLGTQQFTDLTQAIADIQGLDVDAVRERYIPGSAKMHKERV